VVSSVRWFTGFNQSGHVGPASMAHWLLKQNWRRHGLIALDEAAA
jgi:hypothetical protein